MELVELVPMLYELQLYSGSHWEDRSYKVPTIYLNFETFFHSHVSEMIKGLNRGGIPSLLNLSNQSLGNPYLHSRWKPGYVLSTASDAPACIMEGSFGKNPAIGRPGNFEAVILEGNNLQHYWHDSSNATKPWVKAQVITAGATGAGCIIQRQGSTRLDVVVLEGGGLLHYANDNPYAGQNWVPQTVVSNQASAPGCVFESSYKTLEALVLEGSLLVHYRLDQAAGAWVKQGEFITDRATGAGCMIQSSFKAGTHGNFEVVVQEGNQLVHYWKDNAKGEWHRAGVITDAATDAGWIIQSRIFDGAHGNFEVVARESSQLVHYWKDNSDLGSPWRRGQVITTRASASGCIMHGAFGVIGNFEVVVPENGRLVHYWNVNEGALGTEGERFYFRNAYKPTSHVDDPYPRQDLDFSYGGAYANYNWELFFHAPMMLAGRLSKNQRFAEAMRWYHYIFDPTDDSNELTTHRYWKVLPFRDVEKQRIDHMLGVLSDPATKGTPERQRIEDQLDDWGKHPFQPHRIARMRLIAYQKNVVMKYIDNLIAWGDQLFGRDTIESINEATQLYVLAANLLGPRPERIPRLGKSKPQTYAQLRPMLDDFSNAKRALENEFPINSAFASVQVAPETTALLGIGDTFYFCIPQNDKLLGYWDTVADRLFKIRNCMNLQGVVRQLPLFEPPIDPALLVQAAAQGVDLGSVLNDLSSPMPHYRFAYMIQRALELCGDLKSLGAALLAALEKRDAEELATVRAAHEVQMLTQVRIVKEQQVKEAEAAYNALYQSREVMVGKFLDQQRLLGVQDPKVPALEATQAPLFDLPGSIRQGAEGGLPLLEQEQNELDSSHSARDWHVIAATSEIAASIFGAIPTVAVDGKPFGVGLGASFGGPFLAGIASAIAKYQELLAAKDTYDASHAGKMASHFREQQRRAVESNLAAREIIQINKQLIAANIRHNIAYQELQNHDKLIENAQLIEEFLRDKYTNEELHGWMLGEISAIFFQCYQMTFDLARTAERAFRFETGLTNSNFVQFGYWDSLRKGLLAGERLHLALKQMERAYLDQHKREYEITKNVSLLLTDPLALMTLKETGRCEVVLPEALFDADYPGHYMRRIKSVSLTIPCVVGPYTSINCTLTLLSNKTRVKSEVGTGYEEDLEQDDPRFVTNFAAMQSIATSHAQNDSGMFELNFRDERYLPFEGAGAISRWRIDLPKDSNAFDLNSLTDVVLHVKYTAREGGEVLGRMAQKAIHDAFEIAENLPLARLFSAKHEFPTEWHQFLHPTDPAVASQTMQFDLGYERFPFQFRGKRIQISQVELFLKLKDEIDFVADTGKTYTEEYALGTPLKVSLTPSGGAAAAGTLTSVSSAFAGTPHTRTAIKLMPPAKLTFEVKEADIDDIAPELFERIPLGAGGHARLKTDVLEDMLFAVHFSVSDL
jgi:Tc toxin complex TcA C-terminal TcB-binding domain